MDQSLEAKIRQLIEAGNPKADNLRYFLSELTKAVVDLESNPKHYMNCYTRAQRAYRDAGGER